MSTGFWGLKHTPTPITLFFLKYQPNHSGFPSENLYLNGEKRQKRSQRRLKLSSDVSILQSKVNIIEGLNLNSSNLPRSRWLNLNAFKENRLRYFRDLIGCFSVLWEETKADCLECVEFLYTGGDAHRRPSVAFYLLCKYYFVVSRQRSLLCLSCIYNSNSFPSNSFFISDLQRDEGHDRSQTQQNITDTINTSEMLWGETGPPSYLTVG